MTYKDAEKVICKFQEDMKELMNSHLTIECLLLSPSELCRKINDLNADIENLAERIKKYKEYLLKSDLDIDDMIITLSCCDNMINSLHKMIEAGIMWQEIEKDILKSSNGQTNNLTS